MRLWQAVKKWQDYLEKSPFHRQVLLDGEESIWRKKAETYDRTSYPGFQKQLILSHLVPHIDQKGTAIEIGAGPGTFTLSLAKKLTHLTVIEPSPSMRHVLEKRLVKHRVGNVDIIGEKWEDARGAVVNPRDYVFALGCLYAFYRIDKALAGMIRVAEKKVVLLHLSGDGLWEVDYHVARTLHFDLPCFFPPAELLANVLSAMSLNFGMRVVQVPVKKKWPLSEFKTRYEKMFSNREMDELLLEKTLNKNLDVHKGLYLIDESMGFAVIDVDVG